MPAMRLSVILLRLEGVLAQTGEVFRRAANLALAEAGFEHEISRDVFAHEFGHEISRERFLEYASRKLYPRKQTADLRTLFEVTYKRLRATVETSLTGAVLQPGPGVKELLDEGWTENVNFVVISTLPQAIASAIIPNVIGGTFSDDQRPIISALVCEPSGPAADRAISALTRTLSALSVPPQACLVLESTSAGLAAAEKIGISAVAVIDERALTTGILGARAVVGTLADLVHEEGGETGDSAGEMRLLSALKALHAIDHQPVADDPAQNCKVRDILEEKGAAVKSVNPTDTIRYLTQRLLAEKVGAMVVISDTGTIEGIVSERDMPRGLSVHGAGLLDMPVATVMTRAVITCSPDDSIHHVARVMTKRRIRHLPVCEGPRLVGLISIGDVLNKRLDEVQSQARSLRAAAPATGTQPRAR